MKSVRRLILPACLVLGLASLTGWWLTGRPPVKAPAAVPGVAQVSKPEPESRPVVTVPAVVAAAPPIERTRPHLTEAELKQRSEAREQLPGGRSGRPWEDIPEWVTLSPRERLTRLLAQPFGIQNDGRITYLELARDELYVRHQNAESQRSRSIPPQATVEGVLDEAAKLAATVGEMPSLVFYAPGVQRSPQSRIVLANEVLVKAADDKLAVEQLQAAGVKTAAPVSVAPGYVSGKDERFAGAALVAIADVTGKPGIEQALPVMGVKRSKRSTIPNDPLFSKQWHLRNTKQVSGAVAGVDVNVVNVWDTYQGTGVELAIVDDGVQTTHPDLAPNYDAAHSYDYVGGDPVPDPGDLDPDNPDDHGTSCAGVAAARGGNGLGVSGAAPLVTLAGLRLNLNASIPIEEAAALGDYASAISIKSNSWGPPDVPYVVNILSNLTRTALANSVATGRGGKGTIFTVACGNGREDGDQSNKDPFANSIYVNAIGGVGANGAQATYAESGANLIACAPTSGGTSTAPGIVTTDRTGAAGYNIDTATTPWELPDTNYTNDFGGTSSACPLAAGVIALMLEANPNLGWRDVKEILLRSSRKINPTDTDWVTRYGGSTTLLPIKHSHKYGGGLMDAAAAVSMAKTWVNLPTQTSVSRLVNTPSAIPDNNSTGVTASFDFSTASNLRAEMIEVTMSIHHVFRGDLEIQLVSPSGVISNLATATGADDGSEYEDQRPVSFSDLGYQDYTFTTNRHWGEGTSGVWKVVIRDKIKGDSGTFNAATVRIYGSPSTPVTVAPVVVEQLAVAGGAKVLSVTPTAGTPDFLFAWTKNGSVISGATAASYALPGVTTSSIGTYVNITSNVGGNVVSTFKLGVITPPPASVVVNEQATLTLSAPATVPTGLTATYQWKKDGNTITDDPVGPLPQRIKGAQTKTLTVLKADDPDAGSYECMVTMGAATLSSGNAAVIIRNKPDIQLAAFPADLKVSSLPVSIPVPIVNGTTKITVSGLPSGLVYSSTTGLITGIPNTATTAPATITITATNQAGTTVLKLPLSIASLDTRAVGTFNNLIARNSATGANGGFGGSLTNLVIASNGTFSGTLRLAAATAITVKGRLVSSPTADPAATVLITRKLPLLNMTLAFAISRATGDVTGTLTQADSAWTAAVTGARRFATTAIAARQNFWLNPPSGVSSSTAPAGTGFGYASMSSTGSATVVLKLSDGISVTSSTSRGESGFVPAFAMLYANKGSILGNLTITDGVVPALDTVTGAFSWNKTGPSASTDHTYASGFDFGATNPDALTVQGSEYRKPVSPIILWGIPDVAVGGTNAKVTFTGAGIETSAYYLLATGNINKLFRLSTTHAVTMPLPNLAAVSFGSASSSTPLSSTGLFAGKITLKDGTPAVTRTISYSGIVVSAQSQGRGWFKLVQLPGPDYQSGAVLFTQDP